MARNDGNDLSGLSIPTQALDSRIDLPDIRTGRFP